MRRRLLRFDRFSVFIFNMDSGERKELNPDEVTRGLTTHGPHTLNPISVFTMGSFVSIRPGRDVWYSGVGDGGQYFVDCDTLVGHALVATKDGSEYHCIVPRDETPRFWDRSVYTIGKGCWTYLYPREYAYVALGKVDGFSERLIYNSSDRPMPLKSDEHAIIAIMWLDEPQVPA